MTDHPAGGERAAMHEGTTQEIHYRVVVRGRRSRALPEPFEQLELESNGSESSPTGMLADQAQRHGLLDRLQDPRHPIVSVNPVS